MVSHVDVLREARALIADPANWTQHTLARAKSGNIVFASHPDACKWCAYGAICRAADGQFLANDVASSMVSALLADDDDVTDAVHYLTERNDNYSHARVLGMFDTAIDRLDNQRAMVHNSEMEGR